MAEKLDWVYQDQKNEQHAFVGTDIRIRAVPDESPENPFEAWDCNWPVLVRLPDGYGGRTTLVPYPKDGDDLTHPLAWMTDALLVHDQHAISKLLGFDSPAALIECHGHSDDAEDADGKPITYFRCGTTLRDAMTAALDDMGGSDILETYAKLFGIAGIPAHVGTSTGYSQGDWAELLVVGTPDAAQRFGAEATTESLSAMVDLYGAWAWGDVYGYVVERIRLDDDGDVDEELTEEIGSCWGYYGSDHGESGLEEAALEHLPEERLAA